MYMGALERTLILVTTRIETRLGHPSYPEHFLSGPSCFDPVNKISSSDLDSAGLYVLIVASGSDQSNELRILDGDDGSVSPDSPEHIWKRLTIQLEYFVHTSKVLSCYKHFHIILYNIQIVIAHGLVLIKNEKVISRSHAQFMHARVPTNEAHQFTSVIASHSVR